MTKTMMTMTYFRSTMTAVAAVFILAASLSSANAWGDNDQYGKTSSQTSSQTSRQTDGYGGGQGRPTGSSRPSRTTDAYGTGSNSYPTRPCRRCRETWGNDDYRPSHGTVFIPPRRDTYGYGTQPDYRPSRDTYVRPKRDSYGSYGSGDGYGSGSRPSRSTSSWDSSGGYGGRQ